MSKATGYDKISLPTEMINEIKSLIEANPEFGFKSPPEFIREAIRNRMGYYASLAEKGKQLTRRIDSKNNR
ncbi:MAG: ribbon-helix-helix domain-containing protein [Candidatus Hodarchaeales archaeon]|jgi:Arc/MetJ-type ribon-helix-helix transcriptional regulator